MTCGENWLLPGLRLLVISRELSMTKTTEGSKEDQGRGPW